MANQYKNKIIYGDQTLMDITDTTATENDVLEGEVFYSASGARSVGLLGDATQSTHGLMSATDKTKLDGFLSASNYLTSHQDISGKANSVDLATVATTGSYVDLLNKPDLSQYLTSVPVMTGATSSANGTAGLIPAPTSADAEKFFRGDGTWQDGGRPMVILSYGNSTWAQFEEAYNNNVIVYCRASSNANPASGSQTRMAFMAYVNNATTPTNVEFQYYRSVSSHSATQMGDQVFVYKLDKTSGWSVTTREASIKEINVASGSKLGVSWSSNKVTLSNTMTADDMPMSSSDATTAKSEIDTLKTNIAGFATVATSGSYNDLLNKPTIPAIPTNVSSFTNDAGYLTSHQDITGKADKSSTVSNVSYDSTNNKITKTINGTTSDVVTAATLKTAMSLGNVENKSSATIRGELTNSNVTTALGFTPLNASLKGANNGIAELDSSGKVPSSQLPSYVDDVLEYTSQNNFPTTGETGKIYVATDTNKTYRWSGTAYVEISPSLALGETSSTAYRGDRGKAAYDHASAKGSAFASGLYKITTNSEGHVTAATAVAKADITGLGIPGSDTNTHRPIQVNGTQILGDNTTALNFKAGSNVSVTNSSGTVTIAATDTTYSDATTSASGLMSSSDKTKLNGIATGAEVNQNAFSNVVVGDTTVSADSKTDTLTLAAGSNITITPDSTNDKITIAATDTNTHRPIQVNGTEVLGNNTTALNLKAGSNVTVTNSSGTVTIAATDTTYSSKSAASGGTDVSLVTTGEKYTWNNKSNLTIGTSSTTAAAGNHTHGLSMAISSGTNAITLAASTKYQITAGGSTYIFTTPPNTTYSAATTSANGLMSSDDKTKLNGIATGAEVNQNAFSNIAVGSTTVAADSKTDTLTLTAGSNITITPDATNNNITIAATDTDTWRPMSDILAAVYPIGSIYISVTSTSPETLFGGTWERLKSRFLLGAEDTGDTTNDPYVGGAAGGAASRSYTPAGTNTGCAVTDHTYTPAGTNSGGAVQNHTLTASEMPKHNHSFTGSAVTSGGISANHTHTGTSGNPSANHTHSGPSHSHTVYVLSKKAVWWVNAYQPGTSRSGVNYDETGQTVVTDSQGTGATGTVSAWHTHTTTTGNPSAGHTHSVTASGTIGDKGSGGAHNHGFTQPTFTGTKATLSHTVTQPTFTGTASTINTMPPYLSVYMWKRTA